MLQLDFRYIHLYPLRIHLYMQVCALLSVCVVLWCKNKTSDSREGYIKELTG